jgi:DNA-binding beta-propeller fold protein YncE
VGAGAGPAAAAPPFTQPASTAGCTSEDGTDGSAAGTVCLDASNLVGARDVAVSPDNKNVYVASSTSGAIEIFVRNVSTGAIAPLATTATSDCISTDGSGGDCADGNALFGANSVTVSPDGKTVYATSTQGLAVLTRNTTTGALTQPADTTGCHAGDHGVHPECTDAGLQMLCPDDVAVSPDNKNVYVPSSCGSSVTVFTRNTTTGLLTKGSDDDGCINEAGSDSCANGKGLSGAADVAVSPDGKNVYAAGSTGDNVAVLARDATTGFLTQGSGTDACVSDTGTAGACTDVRALDGPTAIAASPDNASVYVAAGTSDALDIFSRNASTGALTQPAGSAGCTSETGRSVPGDAATAGQCGNGKALDGPAGVAASADNLSVYVTAATSNAVAVFGRNASTGLMAQLTPGTTGCISDDGTTGSCQNGRALLEPRGVAISADGASGYAASAASDAVDVFQRASDIDGDGFTNASDICPNNFDPAQTNTDGDGQGNACDANDDNDAFDDVDDNCITVVNDDQTDTDSDGGGDACDKDDDGDTVEDPDDNCPLAANEKQEDNDGDHAGDACDPDDDNDGVTDAGPPPDNCQFAANANQANNDGDTRGDVCDPDDDNDGVSDVVDNCDFTGPADQTNTDGLPDGGDVCDTDDDNDGLADTADNCRVVVNADQANLEGDELGDACDADDDNDAVADDADNCPRDSNATQTNTDGRPDGGDACDGDDDNDGLGDAQDNCPTAINVDQADADGVDGGDACDPDDDNDGLTDEQEDALDTSPVDLDSDDDGIGDAAETSTNPADSDSDNDRLKDGLELGLRTGIADPPGRVRGTKLDEFEPDRDPRTRTKPNKADTDRDGLKDGQEDFNQNGRFEKKRRETNPLKKDTDRDGKSDRKDRFPLNPRKR